MGKLQWNKIRPIKQSRMMNVRNTASNGPFSLYRLDIAQAQLPTMIRDRTLVVTVLIS